MSSRRATVRRLKRRRAHGRSPAGSSGAVRREQLERVGAQPTPPGQAPKHTLAHTKDVQSLFVGIMPAADRAGLRMIGFNNASRAGAKRLAEEKAQKKSSGRPNKTASAKIIK